MEVQECSSERAIDNKIISLPEYFRKQRKVLQETGDEGEEYYSTKKIADNLEISSDMLQKKLNGGKPLSREWLIAICAAFGLDGVKTNEVLNFAGYPKLDNEVPWENFITDFINEKSNINILHTLKEINDYLMENGCNGICSKFRRNQASEVNSAISKAEQYEVKKTIKTITDKVDTFNSLGIRYDFRSKILAVAYLIKDGEIKYTLQVSGDGEYFSSEENGNITTYKNISETGEFACYFSELFVLARNEQRRIEFQVFDTKNYKDRFGADIKNDSLHVFHEKFNYYIPERNEYCLMEYIDGKLRFSVCTQSMFMKEYLTEEEYDKHYGYIPVKERTIHDSFKKHYHAANFFESSDYESQILKYRYNMFLDLAYMLIDDIKKIKNQTWYIRNIYDMFENPYDVIKYYHLENEFDCKYDEEHNISSASKKTKIFYNDEIVSISFEELKFAFELGIDDFEQIYCIKKKYNNIKGIISSINPGELEKTELNVF